MSNYHAVTRHPQTGLWEDAEWIDGYFGHYIYGVKFASDMKIYPTNLVKKKDIKEFWAIDVMNAFAKILDMIEKLDRVNKDNNAYMVLFLNYIEEEYKARWERDPIHGEGAVKWLRELRK